MVPPPGLVRPLDESTHPLPEAVGARMRSCVEARQDMVALKKLADVDLCQAEALAFHS